MGPHVSDSLWDYLRGGLEPAERERTARHLQACPECSGAAEKIRAAQQLAQPLPVPPLGAERWAALDLRVAAAARAALAPPRPTSLLRKLATRRAGWALAAAAAAVVAVVVVRGLPFADLPRPQRAASGASLRALHGRAESLTLPDGSRLTVLPGGSVRLAVVEPEKINLELERGRVVIDAAHRPGRPFQVFAGDVEVQVTGTRFLLDRDEAKVLVAVAEGAVEVKTARSTQLLTAQRAARRSVESFDEQPLARGDFELLAANATHALTLPPPPALEVSAPPVPDTRPAPTPLPLRSRTQGSRSGAPATAPLSSAAVGGAPVAPAPPAVSAPPLVTDPAPAPTPPTAKESSLLQRALQSGEALVKKFPQVLLQRVPPVGRMVGEFRARQLEELTDRGECQAVLEGADAWLATYSTDAGEPTYLSDRRAVLFSKARCLARLGRTEEAAEARTQANQ